MNARKMITRADIEREIIRRYIAPTRKKRADYIGVEFELPIVNKKKQAVDFHVVHAMTESFAKEFGFTDFRYDDEGNICAAQDPPTQDDLSFDCSYNTLEFSFGREQNLNVIHQRFQSYISYINQFLGEHNHCATGMGINPYYKYNEITPVPNGRYRMLLHHLSSYEKYADQMLFHNIPYYGLIACSAQTHINAHEQNLPETINLFNMLEPLKALLFANSPSGDYLCLRDHLWRESMHGLNPHNVDCWNIHVDSVEEIAAYIRSMSLYCTERDGKYINFAPVPLDEYFASDSIEGEYYDGGLYRHITWEPELSDLQYLRSFKFVDLTFRGTLELRSACMQPVSEAMTVPAFHLGLACEMDRVRKILDDISIYRQGYTIAELRKQFVMRSLPAFADKTELQDALVQLVETAQAGLQRRGLGEEALLRPLKRRAAAMKSPALEVMEGLEAGRSLEEYIAKYAVLEDTDETAF